MEVDQTRSVLVFFTLDADHICICDGSVCVELRTTNIMLLLQYALIYILLFELKALLTYLPIVLVVHESAHAFDATFRTLICHVNAF